MAPFNIAAIQGPEDESGEDTPESLEAANPISEEGRELIRDLAKETGDSKIEVAFERLETRGDSITLEDYVERKTFGVTESTHYVRVIKTDSNGLERAEMRTGSRGDKGWDAQGEFVTIKSPTVVIIFEGGSETRNLPTGQEVVGSYRKYRVLSTDPDQAKKTFEAQ